MAATLKNLRFSFFLPVTVFVIAGFIILRSSLFRMNPGWVSFGFTFDFLVTVPAFYYLLIRKSGVSKLSVLPVIFAMHLVASLFIPAENRQFLYLYRLVVFPLLGLFLVYSSFRALRSRQAESSGLTFNTFEEKIHFLLSGLIPIPRVLQIAVSEISLFYYAFFSWQQKPPVLTHRQTFTYLQESGYQAIWWVLVSLVLIETVALHFLVAEFSFVLASILTYSSVYTLVFLVADYNAMRLKPIQLDNQSLAIQIGLRLQALIPLQAIKSISVTGQEPADPQFYLKATPLGAPNVLIELKEVLVAKRIYGLRKKFTAIGLQLDEPQLFQAIITKQLEE